MRRRLTQAITMGLSLAGCSDRTISDTQAEAGGDTSSTGGGPTTGTGTTSTASTSTASTTVMAEAEVASDAEVDDGNIYFDVGKPPDFDAEPDLCDVPPPPLGLACAAGPTPDEILWLAMCVPSEPDGGCLPETDELIRSALEECSSTIKVPGCDSEVEKICEPPTVLGDQCCYWAGFTIYYCPGRPFTVDGRDRLAELTHRDDGHDPWPDAEPDALLARAWLFDARTEHAAIASFSRFALQLLALAAPPRLVDAALRAAIDEGEHASLFLRLAHAYGETRGPGRLDVEGALAGADDPIHVVVATVREGCIAETISAMQLQRACTTAVDPELRAALGRVLEQELRHVELAWAFVAWACERGDDHLRAAVRDAFREAERSIPRGADVEPAPSDAERWRRCGRLTHADAQAIAHATIRNVVRPAAQELLARLDRASRSGMFGAARASLG